jgi:hypothetical protein
MSTGSADLKSTLYQAVVDLVGPAPLNERLRRAAWVIDDLIEDDFPSNAAPVFVRFAALKQKLTGYRLLSNDPLTIPLADAWALAEGLLTVFALICDPREFEHLDRPYGPV